MVPAPILSFLHFCPVPVWHGKLPVLALNGASTGNVKEHYVKWHKIYAGTSFVPPLSGALLGLVICTNCYPVVLYSSGNGSKKNASTRTDPNTRTGMSITSNGNFCILVRTFMLNSSESCSSDTSLVVDSSLLSLFILLGSYCSSSSLVKLYLAHLDSISWSNKSLILFRQCLGGRQLLISL